MVQISKLLGYEKYIKLFTKRLIRTSDLSLSNHYHIKRKTRLTIFFGLLKWLTRGNIGLEGDGRGEDYINSFLYLRRIF